MYLSYHYQQQQETVNMLVLEVRAWDCSGVCALIKAYVAGGNVKLAL